MKSIEQLLVIVLAVLIQSTCLCARSSTSMKYPAVTAPPKVADLALQRTYDIVTHMLAGRPDVLRALVERGMYLVIIGKDQVYTDLPKNRNARNPDYLNERVRGTGGFPTSFGEENLLSRRINPLSSCGNVKIT